MRNILYVTLLNILRGDGQFLKGSMLFASMTNIYQVLLIQTDVQSECHKLEFMKFTKYILDSKSLFNKHLLQLFDIFVRLFYKRKKSYLCYFRI